MFKSTDGGATWSPVNNGLTNKSVWALAIDPSTPTTLYAGTWNGVFKSINGGTTWSANGLTGNGVFALAIDPSTPTTLYAGTNGGVFKSINGGTTWSATGTGPTASSRDIFGCSKNRQNRIVENSTYPLDDFGFR